MRIHPLKYATEADKNKVSTAKIDTFVNKTVYSKRHAKRITNLVGRDVGPRLMDQLLQSKELALGD